MTILSAVEERFYLLNFVSHNIFSLFLLHSKSYQLTFIQKHGKKGAWEPFDFLIYFSILSMEFVKKLLMKYKKIVYYAC